MNQRQFARPTIQLKVFLAAARRVRAARGADQLNTESWTYARRAIRRREQQ